MFICVNKKNHVQSNMSQNIALCSRYVHLCQKEQFSVKYFSKYRCLQYIYVCVNKKNNFNSNISQNNMFSRYVHLSTRKTIFSQMFLKISPCVQDVYICVNKKKQFSVKRFSNYRYVFKICSFGSRRKKKFSQILLKMSLCVQDMFICVNAKKNSVKYFSKYCRMFKIRSFVSTRKTIFSQIFLKLSLCSRYVHLCQEEKQFSQILLKMSLCVQDMFICVNTKKKFQSNIFQNIATCLRYVHLCQQEKQFSDKYFSNYRCVQDMFICVKKKKQFSQILLKMSLCVQDMFICVNAKKKIQSNIFQNIAMCSRYVHLCQQENYYQSSISQNIALFIYANTKKRRKKAKHFTNCQRIKYFSKYRHVFKICSFVWAHVHTLVMNGSTHIPELGQFNVLTKKHPYSLKGVGLRSWLCPRRSEGSWCFFLNLPILRPLLSKAQRCKEFWKSFKPYHVAIHWIALAEYSQMSTHLPRFRSFFRFFASFCIGQINHHKHKAYKFTPLTKNTHREIPWKGSVWGPDCARGDQQGPDISSYTFQYWGQFCSKHMDAKTFENHPNPALLVLIW